MPVSLETSENGRVQYYTIADPWTAGDLTSLYPDDAAYRNSVTFKVHTLIDLSGSRQVPPGVLSARLRSPALEHPLSGQLIVIGASSLTKVMSEMALRLARNSKAKFFNTADEAWTYLRQWIAEHPE